MIAVYISIGILFASVVVLFAMMGHLALHLPQVALARSDGVISGPP